MLIFSALNLFYVVTSNVLHILLFKIPKNVLYLILPHASKLHQKPRWHILWSSATHLPCLESIWGMVLVLYKNRQLEKLLDFLGLFFYLHHMLLLLHFFTYRNHLTIKMSSSLRTYLLGFFFFSTFLKCSTNGIFILVYILNPFPLKFVSFCAAMTSEFSLIMVKK